MKKSLSITKIQNLFSAQLPDEKNGQMTVWLDWSRRANPGEKPSKIPQNPAKTEFWYLTKTHWSHAEICSPSKYLSINNEFCF